MPQVKFEDRLGTVVVLLDDSDKTLILLRSRDSHWAPSQWGFPGGKIEEGEAPRDAAVRETSEETALDATDLKIITFKHNLPCVAYYTRKYTGVVTIDHEHEDWQWVSWDEMDNYDVAPGVRELYDWVLKNE